MTPVEFRPLAWVDGRFVSLLNDVEMARHSSSMRFCVMTLLRTLSWHCSDRLGMQSRRRLTQRNHFNVFWVAGHSDNLEAFWLNDLRV
jgi:hypothetical protein